MRVEVAGPADMDEVFALRHEVFVLGQDVPEDLELDEHDAVAVHAVARAEGTVVGTGRLLPPGLQGESAAIGRMAVAEAHRGTGVGRAVLALLESCAAERGWDVVELHAQTHALAFYERAGWTAYGEEFDDAGIQHRHMRKTVTSG